MSKLDEVRTWVNLFGKSSSDLGKLDHEIKYKLEHDWLKKQAQLK